MPSHPEVEQLVNQFKAMELHAARSGREIMWVMGEMIQSSPASSVQQLAAEMEEVVDVLLQVLPAYAPPLNALHRILSCLERGLMASLPLQDLKSSLLDEVESYRQWSARAAGRICSYGAANIPNGGTVYTHTLSETVVRTLTSARQDGKRFRVRVSESNPNRDGLDTAVKLHQAGIPVQVSIDAALGELLSGADLMISGAEAILADGSASCKVGTRPAAQMAKRLGVPVFIFADTLKFNPSSKMGLASARHPLAYEDIYASGQEGDRQVTGDLFDRTPPGLISAVVTEQGVLSPAGCSLLMQKMPLSEMLCLKLPAYTAARRTTKGLRKAG